jgi:hypothetical protein
MAFKMCMVGEKFFKTIWICLCIWCDLGVEMYFFSFSFLFFESEAIWLWFKWFSLFFEKNNKNNNNEFYFPYGKDLRMRR